MPGIQLPNFISSVTRERFFPKVVDNVFEGNVLFKRLRGKARPWTGGTRLTIPVTLSKRAALGSYSGFDTFDTTQDDVRQQFNIDPSQYYANITINGIQKAVNKGPEGFVNILAAEFNDSSRELAEKIGEDMYLDGTGNSNKAIAGLQYHVDDGTVASTYQGLSRTTYSRLNATLSTQSGALAFSDLASDYDAAQRGSESPTLIVTTPAVFTIIEALMTPTYNFEFNKRYPVGAATGQSEGSGIVGSSGINAFFYRGVPVLADEKCTAQNLYTLNENYLTLYAIAHDPMLVAGSQEGFAWTGWKKSINQDAIVGQLLFAGQLVGESPRLMARRTSISS